MTTTTTASADGGGGGGAPSPSPPNLLLQLPPAAATTGGQPPQRGPGLSPGPPATAQVQMPRPTLLMDVAIRCTAPSCSCDCFSPCKTQIRICDGCGHGWVSHALDKLGFRHLLNCHQVEVVQPSIAFDVASLMLYGTHAIPIRLKILLDRLFSVLQHDEVLQVLHGFGWTYEDYARGYIIQDPSGHILDRWLLASREEEPLILQQFLRFGETKTVAQQLLLQESSERSEFVVQSPRAESDIKKFIERTHRSTTVFKHYHGHVGYPVPVYGTRHHHHHHTAPSFQRQTSSSVSSAQSASPTDSSTANCTSPMSSSPLNKLQNMQPYDYRREKSSPELPKTETYSVSSLSSPTSSVPNSFTTTAPAATHLMNVTATNHSTEQSVHEDTGVFSEDEDDEESAVNLTRSSMASGGYLDSVFAAKKVRHLRKSANPMKRRWNPSVLATLSTNPATGKKRVQCHVCLKTFCDKGALKIHFSAVHLREMHKCTVEGCNMMFSSRRSRNRHSANPNPKLHTPNYRRKINPHDGRAANPYPLMPPTGILDFTNGFMSSFSSGHNEGDSSSGSDMEQRTARASSAPVERRKENNPPLEPPEVQRHHDEDVPLPLTKKCRIEVPCKDEGIDLTMKEDRSRVEEAKDLRVCEADRARIPQKEVAPTTKSDHTGNKIVVKPERTDHDSRIMERDRLLLSTKGVRKRKSLNPTKCPTDDDLQFVSSDDSSSDTYIDQDNDDNGLLDSKSDFLSSDGSDSMNDIDDLDENTSEVEKEKKEPVRANCASPVSSAVTAPVQPGRNSVEKSYHNHERFNGFMISEMDRYRHEMLRNQKDNEDISENPLRHLESLSLGAFTNMVNSGHRGNASVSSGVSFHAPGLGLASVTTTTATHRSESPPLPPLISSSTPLPPPAPGSNCTLNNSDTENSMSEQQMPLLPVYRDASMVGSVEIPVDKENPRRCTACGKIFQNHFGVKTHYQNVHLKLMHKCTVEGCNAAFPSKRSRDRHSANLNLHRKLLSTSSDKSSGSYFDKSGSLYPFHPDGFRGEFFSRIYDPQALTLSFAEMYHSRISAEGTGSPFLGGPPFNHLPGTIPGFHPAFLPPSTTVPTFKSDDGRYLRNDTEQHSGRNSSISSISNPSSPGRDSPRRSSSSVKLEEDLVPDSEGRFACTFCEKKFHEGVVLREHYEKCHTQSLFHCSSDGCNKVFLSRHSRSSHGDRMHKEKVADAT